MDFWDSYRVERLKPEFGSKQLLLNTMERHNSSLARVQDRALELGVNSGICQRYNPEIRYIIAREITFDLLATFYDVNSSSSVVLRMTAPDKASVQKARALLERLKKPKTEIRLIGLQDDNQELIGTIEGIHGSIEGRLIELDLFDKNIRHIVIDLKSGMSYNLLILNRIYKPGELANTVTQESFQLKKSELKFA